MQALDELDQELQAAADDPELALTELSADADVIKQKFTQVSSDVELLTSNTNRK